MQSLLNSDHIEMDEEAPPSPPRVARSIPLSHTSFYSVEYPGYVAPQSVPKAVERLGGPHNVTETFKRGLKIDLRLKDNDLWAHPPTGQTVSTHNLLLKVVRRKRKQSPSTASPEDNESLGQFTTEVMGMIPKTIRFRNPIDFQYRPPKDDPVVQLREAMTRLDANYILSYRLPEEKDDYSLSKEEQEARGLASSSNVRAIPPPLFTAYDMPINYNFKQKSASVEQVVIDKVTGERTTRLVHAGRLQDSYPIAIKWDEPTPNTCGPEREALRSIIKADLLQKIEEQLEKRPIWTRLGLLNQLSPDSVRQLQNAKYTWAICTYVFQDGPWRDSVVKLGYDPRQDQEAVMYQIVSIRNIKNRSTRPSMLQTGVSSIDSSRDINSHIFDGVNPRAAGTFLLCDITDEMIREFIDDPKHRSDICDDRDGWLDHVTSERVKAFVKFKHQHLYDTGKPPTEEECSRFLAPDEEYKLHISKKMKGQKRKRAKAKETLPEEEIAARRLELAVFRMQGPEDEEDNMDVD